MAERIRELEQSEQHLLGALASANARLEALPPTPQSGLGPTIFLVTLPKSGSIYLLNMFQKGLGYEPYNVSPGYFPRDLADWHKLRVAAAGGAVVQSHLDASPVNLQSMTHLLTRIQVHLRDPRQATLSMLHHLGRQWDKTKDTGNLLNVLPAPGPGFFDQAFEKRLGWMVDHYLPGCVQWIGEWLDVADKRTAGPDVHLTTFEQFTKDEDEFLARTLEFFQVARNRFVKPAKDQAMTVHFRQGTADEWRSVYSPEQQAKAAAMIPGEWKERFGWKD
jgi:hypothetical protein